MEDQEVARLAQASEQEPREVMLPNPQRNHAYQIGQNALNDEGNLLFLR